MKKRVSALSDHFPRIRTFFFSKEANSLCLMQDESQGTGESHVVSHQHPDLHAGELSNVPIFLLKNFHEVEQGKISTCIQSKTRFTLALPYDISAETGQKSNDKHEPFSPGSIISPRLASRVATFFHC